MPAWTVPVGRRRLTWLVVRREDGSVVVGGNGKETQVLVELTRSRAGPPQGLLQTDAQRERGAVYKWHTPDRSHVEMALRRQHAREARLIQRRVMHDPFMVETDVGGVAGGDSWGVRVPYALLARYKQRDNTDEPIKGSHKNMKYLNPFMGDFEQTVLKDGWSQVAAAGVRGWGWG